MNAIEYTDFLSHHGIKGQKWGIRRYQNEDGTLTLEGIKRYGTSITSGYDRSSKKVRKIAGKEIDEADKAWEKYFKSRDPKDLEDYNKKARAIGKKLIDNKEYFMSDEGHALYLKDMAKYSKNN